jgi:hypothetical protein
MAIIARSKKGANVTVEVALLVQMFSLAFRAINIINICVALIKYLRGGEFVMPPLRRSPIAKMDKEIEAEAVTSDELEAFLLKTSSK